LCACDKIGRGDGPVTTDPLPTEGEKALLKKLPPTADVFELNRVVSNKYRKGFEKEKELHLS
jgi:hypothetical protein